MSEEQKQHRTIRSYVLREGRLTTGQQHAFDTLWPQWGVEFKPEETLDPQQLFGNDQPVVMEIGFGNGESLARYAQLNPQINYLGVEVHGPGVGHLLLKIDDLKLTNLRLLKHDAVEVLNTLPPASLQGLMLFFPDPWHKKRHHKRRILRPEFVTQLARVIRPGGFFHAATDWEHYAEQMMDVLSETTDFNNKAGDSNFSPRPPERPLTKFEQRGQRLGHGVWDLIFIRQHA